MGRVRQIAVEHDNLAALDGAHAGNQRQQGGFADPVGPDHPHHLARRNFNRDVVERNGRPVMVRDIGEPSDNGVGHCGSLT